jgi:ubiquinone/menaquinone biosynthesis C-methylase UbiE
MNKFFQNIKGAVGSTWEETLLLNTNRVSTPLAKRMLIQMGLGNDTNVPFRLFENACGAGVIAPVLQQLIPPDILKQSSVLCGDFSEQLIGLARKRAESERWINTTVSVIDAQVS